MAEHQIWPLPITRMEPMRAYSYFIRLWKGGTSSDPDPSQPYLRGTMWTKCIRVTTSASLTVKLLGAKTVYKWGKAALTKLIRCFCQSICLLIDPHRVSLPVDVSRGQLIDTDRSGCLSICLLIDPHHASLPVNMQEAQSIDARTISWRPGFYQLMWVSI